MKRARIRAAGKEVVSFDLFDTLLVRRIHDPDLVKLPVARYIAALAEQQGVVIGWREVQKLRDEIEQRHRLEAGAEYPDHEACYPRYMSELLGQIFADDQTESLLQKVTGYELAIEKSMLVVRSELADWIKELAASGKRLFVISDMYLPATHLEELLRPTGLLDSIEAVVSSADSFLAKASGAAYPHIAGKYGIESDQWLHIGDNPHSDGLRAAEAGIEALIIADPGEQQRKSIVCRLFKYSDGKPYWRGRVLQQLMSPLEAENVPRSHLYTEGYNFIGPLIGVFVQRIAELCQKKKIGKIFFLSREGWTFKRYWEQAMPLLYPAGGLPEIEYLYVSRMALAGAACAYQGLTKTNAAIAFLPSGNRDFTDVCRIFSLDSSRFRPYLERYSLAEDTCLGHIHKGYRQENRKNFERMLEDEEFQEEVKRQSKDANRAMLRYFEELGMFEHSDVAIVDIGWLGSIQRFLFEAISHREDAPNCHGFLFGATRGVVYKTSEKNTITGILYDKDTFDFSASMILYARDIFEEACRAPYPTLNGYRLAGEGYELVFRQTDDAIGRAERRQDAYFAPLQQGIYDSAARFAAASALLGYGFDDYKPWFNSLLVGKLAFPKTKEILSLKHQYHQDDFNGKNIPDPASIDKFIPLWERPVWQLRFLPFLRLRCFWKHLKDRIIQ
ncbi:MAG: hypothetical protein CSB23_02030 [Deltaproteobacteria bacterium]|nr:MAG: hypothetical protein CSB23_02030 [Deltaproteobacteria bacterium]